MEDTHTIRDDLKFYGVYDGHGGEEAATILQQVSNRFSCSIAALILTTYHILHTHIVESELYINGKIEEAINQAFLSVDKHILQESQVLHNSYYKFMLYSIINYINYTNTYKNHAQL